MLNQVHRAYLRNLMHGKEIREISVFILLTLH